MTALTTEVSMTEVGKWVHSGVSGLRVMSGRVDITRGRSSRGLVNHCPDPAVSTL